VDSGALLTTQKDRDWLVDLTKAKGQLRTGKPPRWVSSLAAEEAEGRVDKSNRACAARPALQPQAGREDQANGAGDTVPGSLCRLRADTGSGIPGRPARYSRGTARPCVLERSRARCGRPKSGGRNEAHPVVEPDVVGVPRPAPTMRSAFNHVPDRRSHIRAG
jgi:hypothetical protein